MIASRTVWSALICLWVYSGSHRPAEAAQGAGARDLALQARRLMDGGDLGGSLSAFRAAREAFEAGVPRETELADFLVLNLYNLGVRMNNAGDADKALSCFAEALRAARASGARPRDQSLRASLVDATLQVAGFLVASGRADQTVEAYGLLWGPPLNDVRGLLGLGSAHLARGDAAAALAAFDRAGALQPDAPDVAAGRGRAALQMSRQANAEDRLSLLEKSAAWLRRARDLEPSVSSRRRDLAGALVELGAAAARSGELDLARTSGTEADEEYRRAVSIDPTSPWPRLDLAVRFLKTRRYVEAAAQFEQAIGALERLIAASPTEHDAGAWRAALESGRENRAIALFNLAVDAINRAEFHRVEPLLGGVCATGPGWAARCRDLHATARAREETFRRAIHAHESELRQEPQRVAALLALGDLYAGAGDYGRALEYYRRIDPKGVPDLADRIAAVSDPGHLTEHVRVLDLPRARVEVRHFRASLPADFERGLKAAWLRVTSVLGEGALRGPLIVSVYPNRRSFRENAGYRVGSMVKGYYAAGQISLFESPSYSALEWVAVLTHELGHHAVETISGGIAPWWLSEGVARYVEGDAAVVDRARVRSRLATGALPQISRLDDLFDLSWNDPLGILDARDEALLIVEEMARRRGGEGLREALERMTDPRIDLPAVFRQVLGAGLPEIDAAWRAAIVKPGA